MVNVVVETALTDENDDTWLYGDTNAERTQDEAETAEKTHNEKKDGAEV